MSEVKLSRASQNVLEKLRRGKRLANELSGYYWLHPGGGHDGRRIPDTVVDPLLAAGLVEEVNEVSPKRGITRTWVKLKEQPS